MYIFLGVTEEVISGIFLLTILWRFMVAKFKYKGIILYLRLKRICACVVLKKRQNEKNIKKRKKGDRRGKKGFKSPYCLRISEISLEILSTITTASATTTKYRRKKKNLLWCAELC